MGDMELTNDFGHDSDHDYYDAQIVPLDSSSDANRFNPIGLLGPVALFAAGLLCMSCTAMIRFLIRKCIIMHSECIRKPLQRKRESYSRLQVAARAFARVQDFTNRSDYPVELPIPRSGRYTGEWFEEKCNRSTKGKKEKTSLFLNFDRRGTVEGIQIRGHYNKERGRFLWGEGVRSDRYNDPHDYYNAIADLEALRSHAEFESIDYDDSTGILKARIYRTDGLEGPAIFTLADEGLSNAMQILMR